MSRLRGCCSLCGIEDTDSWCNRRPHKTLRRMGATRRRRTRRNTIEAYQLD